MMKIIHLSDPHIHTNELFGINSVERFKCALEHIVLNHRDADMFAITGDITDIGDEDSYNLFKKIIKEFNLSWLYDCDLMIDKKGNYKIIEINPRMSGSVAVSIEAGQPIFDNLISLARKKPIKKSQILKRKLIFPYTKLAKA